MFKCIVVNAAPRVLIALLLSVALHALLLANLPKDIVPARDFAADRRFHMKVSRIVRLQVPMPAMPPTPPPAGARIDRSMLKMLRQNAAREQIVLLAARQGNGLPSIAPHILRVTLRPGVVHSQSVLQIRVLVSLDANGVYVRFLNWVIGVPPVRTLRLSRSDPDYPGRICQLFSRDYVLPAIPPLYRGHTYNAEVVATGRRGVASGALIPIAVR